MRLFAPSILLLRHTTVRSMSSPASYSQYLSPPSARAAADIYMLPMFDDNYGYVVVDRGSKAAFAVDIGDAKSSVIRHLKAMERDGVKLEALLCTHKHGDHIGGNADMSAAFPDMTIVGTSYESIPLVKKAVKHEDTFTVGALTVRTLYTPCHTSGHVSYFVTGEAADGLQPMLFCGDTLFVGGCGRFFEGTAAQMLANMRTFSRLPPSTLVCCAHEYTLGNFNFLSSVDRGSAVIADRLAEVTQLRERGQPTVPSTIGEELRSNLFMQCDELRVQQIVGAGSAEACMAKLREMKNGFR